MAEKDPKGLAAALLIIRKAAFDLEDAVVALDDDHLLRTEVDGVIEHLDALADLIERTLPRGVEGGFLRDHLSIISVNVPPPLEKKHTVVGIGRTDTRGPAEAYCSCGWGVGDSQAAGYTATKLMEHLGKEPTPNKLSNWITRANAPFTGFRP